MQGSEAQMFVTRCFGRTLGATTVRRATCCLLMLWAVNWCVFPAGALEGFGPCEAYPPEARAECGHVRVLEDRTKPEGRTIDLNVHILRAATPQGLSPVFLLAGGPGLGATELAGIALYPYSAVRETRDVVLVDQRGTGGSNALPCVEDFMTDPQAVFGRLFDPELIVRCREEALRHADPTLYGTLPVVADLDEVRERLGYDKVILWGGSGGTRTAMVWLREFPQHVEAIAIDGVVPTWFKAPSGYARGCQQAIERIFDDCDAQPSCREAYPDLREEFAELLSSFDAGPRRAQITIEEGRTVEVDMFRGDFAYAVRGILYNSGSIAKLPFWIHEAVSKEGVNEFAQQYWNRNAGLAPVIAMGVHWSVFGTEDVPFIERDRIPELTAGTFLGTYAIDQYTAACNAWQGRGKLPPGFHDSVSSEVPVLLLSGAYDPSTPVGTAEEVARHFPNSRHLVVRNEAHGAGFGCAREAVVKFLQTGSLDGIGSVCEDVGPIEFEVPE